MQTERERIQNAQSGGEIEVNSARDELVEGIHEQGAILKYEKGKYFDSN